MIKTVPLTIPKSAEICGFPTKVYNITKYGIKKRFILLELKKRYGKSQYPAVKLVDMKVEHKQTQDFTQTYSRELIDELSDCINRGEQAIVLQNRRGFAFIQRCMECGWVYECHQCSRCIRKSRC